MKVVFVLNQFLPRQVAGTEMYVYRLSKVLQQSNYSVSVVIPNYDSAENECYEFDGIDVHAYSEMSTPTREIQMGFEKPSGIAAFISRLESIDPDIVHFHEIAGSNGITVYHVEAAKLAGYNTVMTYHLASNTCKTGTMLYMNEGLCDGVIDPLKCSKCAMHFTDAIKSSFIYPFAKIAYQLKADFSRSDSKLATAISYPFVIEQLQARFELMVANIDKHVAIAKWYRSVLIINGVAPGDLDLIMQASPDNKRARKKRGTAGKIRLIFLGRISPFKGLHIILEALLGIDEGLYQLDIYGHGLDDEYSRECFMQIENMPSVFHKGLLNNDKVVETMSSYDALILASTFSEMSPLVISEAIAAGIGVIASNVPGNLESLERTGSGILFKMNDVEDLRQKLQNYFNGEFEEKGESYPDAPSWGDVGDAYRSLYQNLKTG